MPNHHLLSLASTWITELALRDGHRLPAAVAERLGVAVPTARGVVRQLLALQWLAVEGPRSRPRYRPGPMRQVVRSYPLDGLQEDRPWAQDFAPRLDLPPAVARLVEHAFTELVNNAIDHSGGRSVTVSMRQTPVQVQLLVSDDGRGVFDAIVEHFAISDPAEAMLELAKGKLTSQPARHTGRGLCFTARLADVFDLHANQAAFQHMDGRSAPWQPVRPACARGSAVYVAIRLDTARTLDAVLRQHSLDGQGYAFERTVVPLQLAAGPQARLASRAQARRVAARLAQFRRVELDFAGLDDIGHGFADELLRVFPHAHPEVQLVPTNMAPRVAAMVDSVREPLPA